MSIMGVGIDWQHVVKGLVLLAAVIFDVYNKEQGLARISISEWRRPIGQVFLVGLNRVRSRSIAN